RNEAKDIGLPVSQSDKKLEKMMWSLWLDIEKELKERIPFNPIHELMDSSQAPKLLSPVPQLVLPVNAGLVPQVQGNIDEVVKAAAITIDPVDFECKMGLVESSRMAHVCTSNGKILACRTPDLVLQYSVVSTFSGWKQDNN